METRAETIEEAKLILSIGVNSRWICVSICDSIGGHEASLRLALAHRAHCERQIDSLYLDASEREAIFAAEGLTRYAYACGEAHAMLESGEAMR